MKPTAQSRHTKICMHVSYENHLKQDMFVAIALQLCFRMCH